jgi:hypothetical protein
MLVPQLNMLLFIRQTYSIDLYTIEIQLVHFENKGSKTRFPFLFFLSLLFISSWDDDASMGPELRRQKSASMRPGGI